MKKILIFIGLVFAVACYAAPPPELLPLPVAPQDGCMVYAEATESIVPVFFEAQEVAFNFIDDFQLEQLCEQFAELTTGTEVPPISVIIIDYSICSLNEDLPPLIRTRQVLSYNYNRDLQFTNYGYPLSMNWLTPGQ